MTDLEIMLMLEEEGYDPSIENVQIFKEEYLDESSKAQRRRAREWRPKDPFDFSYSIDADRTARILDKHMLGRRASKLIAKHREMIVTGKPDLSGIHSERIKSHPEWMGAEARAEIRRGKREKERLDHLNGKNIDNNHGDKPINASVEYSDYELYQMLDESGYKPSESNLSILKEGLESGKYFLVEEDERMPTGDYAESLDIKRKKLAKNSEISDKKDPDSLKNRLGRTMGIRNTTTVFNLTNRMPKHNKYKYNNYYF